MYTLHGESPEVFLHLGPLEDLVISGNKICKCKEIIQYKKNNDGRCLDKNVSYTSIKQVS